MSDLLNSASLVMIPSGYKEDVVYSQIPTDGSGDLSFTRASNGTRVNSAGLVEVCPWNLADNSEDMNNQPFNVDITVNLTATTSPIGTNNGNKVSETATTNLHAVRTNKATPNGYDIVSIYAKAAERTFIQIQSWADPTNYVNFNLSTGVVSAYSVATIYGIESVGNGWYRCYANVQASGGGIVGVGIITSGTAGWAQSYLGDTSKGVYMWGLQVNIGSTAKPYFPTTDRLNVPRLTYQNGGGGCPSLLLEKQSTNLQIYSEQFDLWSNTSDLTVSANASTSPDGTQNADKLNENSSNAYHIIGDANITLSASTIYTTSFFAKASERSYARMLAPAGNYSTESAYFDLTNGNCSASAGTVSTQSMGDGWYRCIWSLTTSSSVSGGIGMWFGPARNMTDAYNTYTGTNGSGIYAYGAQIEQSSYPTSYIPTTSSSATRVADVCVKSGISSLIGQTEGVAFVDFDFNGNYSGGGVIPLCLDGGAGSELYIWVQTSGLLLCEVANSGSVQASITSAIGSLGRKKIAFAYKQNDFVVYINGTQVGTDTSGTIPTMSRLYVGKYWANNTYDLNAGINQAVLFPTRLTNAELASLTTI